MDYLLTLVKLQLFFLILYHSYHAHDLNKRSIFSWGKEISTKEPDAVVPGYLPALKIHKYNGIQINPIQGPPVYLPNALSGSSNAITLEQFPTAQLSTEHIQQLDVLNRVVPFLPDEDRLHEFDFSSLLPYVDLISEDSLDKIRYAVESTKDKKNSKLLKFIGFLKSIKEKKLKPFKYAAHLGNSLIKKKKEKVQTAFSYLSHPFSEVATQAPQLVTETPTLPGGYPINFPTHFNPFLVTAKPLITPANPFLGIPSADQAREPVESHLASGPSHRAEFYMQNSQSYEYPSHYITPAGTFLSNSNNMQPYSLVPPQNNPVPESTPSPRVQFSENQYQQLPYSFSQQIYSAAPQPQSFVQQRNQFQNQLDSIPSPEDPTQPIKHHPDHNEGATSLDAPHTNNYQIPQQNVNYHGGNYYENPSQNSIQQESPKYYQASVSTSYANTDLTGSGSENIEKIKEQNSNPVITADETENEKKNTPETATTVTVENHQNKIVPSTPPKSKITKLYPIAGESSLHVVYPNTFTENKETGNSESSVSARSTSNS